jgi:hypothetical protein
MGVAKYGATKQQHQRRLPPNIGDFFRSSNTDQKSTFVAFLVSVSIITIPNLL